MTVQDAFFLLIAYTAGSIPFGLIFSKAIAGVNPREHGSRNIGSTNVLRVAGRGAGVLTLVGDILKGLLVVLWVRYSGRGEGWVWITGLGAVIGHNYSIFLAFRGGKGVATGLGVLAGIDLRVGVLVTGVWLVSVSIWRYSSLGAILSFGLLPVVVLFFHPTPMAGVGAACLSGMVLLKHRDNIRRLRNGEEPKIGKR